MIQAAMSQFEEMCTARRGETAARKGEATLTLFQTLIQILA